MKCDINVCNLLLYIKYSNGEFNECDNKSILCFDNNKIIAINELDFTKEQRSNLQNKLHIRPYFISQRVFKEVLYEICYSETFMNLRDIEFSDDSIAKTTEYEDLGYFIIKRNFSNIFELYNNILDDYDTSIRAISINYFGYDFSLTSRGVISAYAPLEVINKLISDNKFNRIILGIR